MEGEYFEEESLQVLPLDDTICDAVDVSIHQAVAAAMGPFEQRIMQAAYAFASGERQPPRALPNVNLRRRWIKGLLTA